MANDSRGSCAGTNGNYHSNNTNNNSSSSSSSSSSNSSSSSSSSSSSGSGSRRRSSMNLCSKKTALPLTSPITIVDMIYTMALVLHVGLTCRHSLKNGSSFEA